MDPIVFSQLHRFLYISDIIYENFQMREKMVWYVESPIVLRCTLFALIYIYALCFFYLQSLVGIPTLYNRIYANPWETKSGGGGGLFSSGCKMVHSAAYRIYNLFSEIFKSNSMKNHENMEISILHIYICQSFNNTDCDIGGSLSKNTHFSVITQLKNKYQPNWLEKTCFAWRHISFL